MKAPRKTLKNINLDREAECYFVCWLMLDCAAQELRLADTAPRSHRFNLPKLVTAN